VELVPGRATSQQTVQRFHSLLTVVGKRPFVVRNRPGFVGNRLQFALIAEAFRCLEEGVASAEDIDEIARSTFGIRLGDFGPIRLADMGGLDTYVAVLTYLTETLGDRFEVPAVLQGLVDAGALGVKSGHGVFPYSAADASELYSRRDAALARRVDTAVTEVPALTEPETG
jgi:3-hydroxybutyryl-CoA dehydrogenase